MDNLKAAASNIAFSLALYSGQMCTAPQNIYVPRDGIRTSEGHMSFDDVAKALAAAVEKLVSDPARAVELTGAIQTDGVMARIADARQLGEVLTDSQSLAHPAFPDAHVRSPLMLKMDVRTDAAKFTREWFGPISFVIATDSTAQSRPGRIDCRGTRCGFRVQHNDAVVDAAYDTDSRRWRTQST